MDATAMSKKTVPRFSIVVPVYRGASTLRALHRRLAAVFEGLGESCEILLVDDGSDDDSWALIGSLAAEDPRVLGIRLMRNYGQANATMAGLEAARGELLITLDDDLQHPPEEIPRLYAALEEDPDLDMVLGVPQEKRHALWRNLASNLLNWLHRRLSGRRRSYKLTTFRMLRRRAVEPLLEMNLPNPAPGAMLETITRRSASVVIDHAPRRDGRSGYTLAKMVNKTVHMLLDFSTFPLRALALAGTAGVGLSLILGVYYLAKFLSGRIGVPGFTTLILLLILISGFNFLAFGIFGEYLQQILLTVRRTPPYLVRERVAREEIRGPEPPANDRRRAPAELTAGELRPLVERFGEAFYLCDVDTFRRNYRGFLAAFATVYPRVRLAYSYKTNYLPLLCRRVDEWGGYAEVVSSLEYELAVRLGVDPPHILWNGPYKRQRDLERALVAGAVVNLDGAYEIPHLKAVAERHPGRVLNVGLRCAFDIGSDSPSRFGFDVDGGELDDAVRRLRAIPGVRLAGLHCHFLPPGRTAEAYAAISRRMLGLTRSLFADPAERFVDLGGAFFSRMPAAFAAQFGGAIPTFEEYGEAVARPFAEAFPDGGGPRLILEPGLALAADALRFVARVLDVKTVAGRRTALVSGSVYNVMPTKSRRNPPLTRIAAGDAGSPAAGSPAAGPLDLVGYTCMEDDVLYRGYEGEIAAGDFVVFDNAGAYTLVLKPPFIEPAPPVLAIEGGELWPVRRAETFDDLFATFEL